jgi:hypothetical protein
MTYPPCPECYGENVFLGNESESRKSGFKFKAKQRGFSLKLDEQPGFESEVPA